MKSTRNPTDGYPMTRGYSYIRWSSFNQKHGDSLRRQSAFAEQVCRDEGWILDTELQMTDEGKSAFHGVNASVGALSAFVNEVNKGTVPAGSVLIIESLDRLSREVVGEALSLFTTLLRAGIRILTREPRRLYTRESCNDLVSLLEPLMIFARAHEESKIKSLRAKDFWQEKRKQATRDKRPVTNKRPAWIGWTGEQFTLMSPHAETIRSVFRMVEEGLGSHRILMRMIAEPKRYPLLPKSKGWSASYIHKILRNPQTFGQNQLCVREGLKRDIPSGKPIDDYFPAVIDRETFDRVQAIISGRKRLAGRPGKGEANLFTSIVHHVGSRDSFTLRTSRVRQYVYQTLEVSRGGKYMAKHHRAFSIRYTQFEEAVLDTLAELTPSDVAEDPKDASAKEREISNLAGQLETLDFRISAEEKNAADPTNPDYEIAKGILRVLYTEKKETIKRLETLRHDTARRKAVNLGEVQALIPMMKLMKGKELEKLRIRLKAKIRTLVESIWVHVERTNHIRRTAHVQIFLRSGAKRALVLFAPALKPDQAPPEHSDFSGVDFRFWNPPGM